VGAGSSVHVGQHKEHGTSMYMACPAIQEDGTLAQLKESYIAIESTECSSQLSESAAITLGDIYGLWIILSCGLLVRCVSLGL
jgi:hypothetical protein